MDTSDSHETRVVEYLDGKIHRFQVWCLICDEVGLPQELEGDAEAIADRHGEMGGFERPGSLGERLGFQPINSRTHGYNGQEHR